MTLEQQQALALASARLRLQEQEDKQSGSTLEQQTQAAIPIAKPEQKPSVKFDELYQKPENLAIIRDYAESRYGETGKQKKDETDQDYAKRFMTAMRQVEWNTSINAIPELNWIYNAKEKDALKAAKAFDLYESTASWYEKGGQPGVRPFAEAAFSAISEPTNILSFGIGAAARQQAARAGIKAALSTKIKTVAKGAGAEAVLGTGETAISLQRDLKNQQILDTDQAKTQLSTAREQLNSGNISQEQFNKVKQDYDTKISDINKRQISKGEAALGGAISAVFGAAEARAAFKTPKITTKQDLDSVLAGRKPASKEVDQATKSLTDAFDKDMDETLRQFDIFEGRKILDEINPPTGITQAEVKTDINKRAINVAKSILLVDPNFSDVARRVGIGQQKVSSAVSQVFDSLDKIDDVALERALQKEGLTLQEFSKVTGTTVSDAASVMQGYSSLARILKRQAQIDPEAQKIIDDMYLRDKAVPDALITLKNGINRFERESKALVVSSIATTVRNVLGTSVSLTFDAAARFIDSTLYQTGKVVKSAKNGTYEKGDLTVGLNTIVRDTFNTLTYLTNGGITSEVVDRIMVDNPKIRDQLFSALQESGNSKLTAVSRMANTFNVAQDAMFRKAIFTASVERQLRRVGMDMYKILADDKAIPSDVVKNAADESLKATFSYMPKQGVAHHFVKTMEQVPGGSLLVTFPRFMVNAMAFQFKYSPVGAVFGAADLGLAALNKSKDPELAARLSMRGMEKMSKALVGTAALGAAIDYRMNNQDSPWYSITGEDGSTVDTRAIFPIAPYLAVGEYIARNIQGKGSTVKVKEIVETLVGAKIPGGAQGYIIEELTKAFNNAEGKEAEKLEKGLGTVFGDFANRFIQPAQPIFNFFELFNTQSQIARDPNVITSDNIITESAMNRMKSKVPGLKEDLPEAKRYLREETPVRAGEFFNTLMGVRIVPKANELEREFTRLGMDPYKYFGSTGDKIIDRAVIEKTAPYINKMVVPLLSTPRYNKLPDEEKVLALSANIKDAVDLGRPIAQSQMLGKDKARMDKLTFNQKTIEERNAINLRYKKEYGVTMDEAKDYSQVEKYDAIIKGIR